MKGETGSLTLRPGVYTYPEIPANLVGTWYLPVPSPDDGAGKDLRRVGPAFDTNMTMLVFDLEAGEDSGHLEGTGVYGGFYAGIVRSLQASADDGLSRQIFGLYMETEIPGFNLESIESRYLDDLGKSPVLEFAGTLPVSVIPAGGGEFSLSLPWCVSLPGDLLNTGTAGTSDLDIAYPGLASPRKQVIVVSLPPEYTLRELPESRTFRYKAARAGFRWSRQGGRIICERELFIPVTTVSAEDVEEFHRFLTEVHLKEKEPLLVGSVDWPESTDGWR